MSMKIDKDKRKGIIGTMAMGKSFPKTLPHKPSLCLCRLARPKKKLLRKSSHKQQMNHW